MIRLMGCIISVSSFLVFDLSVKANETDSIYAIKSTEKIVIDGRPSESLWQTSQWYPINHMILGETPTHTDFSGRYKVAWDIRRLYLLVEIVDDVLFDAYPDPLTRYWDDDCLEVFIDENASGGDHLNNFNAFAYHVALDNQVVDLGMPAENGTSQPILLNGHIENRWRKSTHKPTTIIWELAIKIFDDKFTTDEKNEKQPVTLFKGKQIGFMLAYCDNDGSKQREHFIGSHFIEPKNGDKNLGYKDASVFGKLILQK